MTLTVHKLKQMDRFDDNSVDIMTTRALQPVTTCRQSPYLHKPAIIIMTSFSLWRHSLLIWPRPALRYVRTDTLPRLIYKDFLTTHRKDVTSVLPSRGWGSRPLPWRPEARCTSAWRRACCRDAPAIWTCISRESRTGRTPREKVREPRWRGRPATHHNPGISVSHVRRLDPDLSGLVNNTVTAR